MTEFAAADGYTTINCFLFASYDNLIASTLSHISYYSVYCSTVTTPIILFLFGICWIESSGLVVCSASALDWCFFLFFCHRLDLVQPILQNISSRRAAKNRKKNNPPADMRCRTRPYNKTIFLFFK